MPSGFMPALDEPDRISLLFLYIDTAEIVSDSTAVKGCSKEKRRDYATLLVLEASTSDILPVV